jgi:hypothetical protein
MKCPFCNSLIPVHKEWTVVCQNCKSVVSTRREIYPIAHYLNGTDSELLQKFIDYVEIDLSPESWGFHEHIRLPNNLTAIYDSEFCRVKCVLAPSDFGPVYATHIFYSRLHAPDNQQYIKWNNENCLCWHSNIMELTLPFIEGIAPQQLVENSGDIRKSLEKALNVFPSDQIEYPLMLHSRIWEKYGRKLFSIFDLREPELWKEYSKYSNEYNEFHQKKWKVSYVIEKIC